MPGKYLTGYLPGIYLGIYQFCLQIRYLPGWVFEGIYPGKYPGKYPKCIYLKVFTFSLLANLQNFTNFWQNTNQNG